MSTKSTSSTIRKKSCQCLRKNLKWWFERRETLTTTSEIWYLTGKKCKEGIPKKRRRSMLNLEKLCWRTSMTWVTSTTTSPKKNNQSILLQTSNHKKKKKKRKRVILWRKSAITNPTTSTSLKKWKNLSRITHNHLKKRNTRSWRVVRCFLKKKKKRSQSEMRGKKRKNFTLNPLIFREKNLKKEDQKRKNLSKRARRAITRKRRKW